VIPTRVHTCAPRKPSAVLSAWSLSTAILHLDQRLTLNRNLTVNLRFHGITSP
jgi:hypothetical protein